MSGTRQPVIRQTIRTGAVLFVSLLTACSTVPGTPGPSGQTSSPASSPASASPAASCVPTNPISPRPSQPMSAVQKTSKDTVQDLDVKAPVWDANLSSEAPTCYELAASMTPEQRVELLYMGAITTTNAADAVAQLASQPVSSVIMMKNPGDRQAAANISSALSQAQPNVLIATDQEGGLVQRMSGPGFTPIPSAQDQSKMAPQALRENWTDWARQLRQAGVHYDLAPVADLVPLEKMQTNQPIGALGRGYGNSRGEVVQNVRSVLAGMHNSGIRAAAKHFPGIGEVTANTDFGVAHDQVTNRDSAAVGVFADVAGDADSIMISSVIYDQLDASQPAAFSRAIITGLLREQLGYSKVVISDDLGAAAAVADYPSAQRGTLFLRAGGDLALNVHPASVAAMVADTKAAVAADPQFAEDTIAKAARVLQLKADAGLWWC